MKKGITKEKFCISLNKELFQKIQKKCRETGLKRSTYIERIIKEWGDEK